MNELLTDAGNDTAPTTPANLDPRAAAIAMLDQLNPTSDEVVGEGDEAPPPTDETVGEEGVSEAQDAPEDVEEQPQEEASQEPEKVEEEAPKDKLSSRFAALAREEKRIRQQRDELKRHAEELQTFKGAIEKLRTDPLTALQELGVDYDALTRRVLHGNQPDPIDEIKALKEQQQAWIREQQEAQARAEQARVQEVFQQAKRDIAAMATSSAEKFPLVASWDPGEVAESAFALIEQHYSRTGTALSYEQALTEIENRLDAQRERLLKAKPVVAPVQKQPPRSITNRVAAQQGKVASEMTTEERRLAAIRMLDAQAS